MPLHLIRQDITKMECDIIVNTTNPKMIPYSGVDRAIHEKAGKELAEECKALIPLALGTAKLTKAYGLSCRYIIHTVGPVWRGGGYREQEILRFCYTEALHLALAHECQSIAFPLISSGRYGYPKDQVLKDAVDIITEFLKEQEMTVYLCIFDRESYEFSRVRFHDIQVFIDDQYQKEYEQMHLLGHAYHEERAEMIDYRRRSLQSPQYSASVEKACAPCANAKVSLEVFLEDMHDGFSETLFAMIDKKGISDVECYKRANVDRKTFSRIRCKKDYKPSKTTAIAFAIALELNLEQTQKLLESAGFTLSHSSKFDMIIEYFILHKIYDIFEINEALFAFDQVLLGSA